MNEQPTALDEALAEAAAHIRDAATTAAEKLSAAMRTAADQAAGHTDAATTLEFEWGTIVQRLAAIVHTQTGIRPHLVNERDVDTTTSERQWIEILSTLLALLEDTPPPPSPLLGQGLSA